MSQATYLNRYGETIEIGSDCVEIPEGVSLEQKYVCYVYDSEDEYVGDEEFDGYPTRSQIMYCVLRHGGTNAVVKREYHLRYKGELSNG